MKKLIIGVVAADSISYSKNDILGNIISYSYVKKIESNDAVALGIVTSGKDKKIDEDILKLCDGFIIQGGMDVNDYHLQVVDYAYKNDVPLLGICLGMQAIGIYSSNKNSLNYIGNDSHSNSEHEIKTKKNTLLNKLFGNMVKVNSRHIQTINEVSLPFKVTATSTDGIIEAIECNDKKFIVGVQWHPEGMKSMDKLFDYFFNTCKKEVI